MATITHDTLGWYGFDEYGASVHDVIGTRCDPYTYRLLTGGTYHHCCHSNLTRALAAETGLPLAAAEAHVHDVLNVFMCTGFTRDTGQYFMKASPVRPGDFLEFFAEIDLLGALSACPGGDCSAEHSSDAATCYQLRVEILRPASGTLAGWAPPEPNGYGRCHGLPRFLEYEPLAADVRLTAPKRLEFLVQPACGIIQQVRVHEVRVRPTQIGLAPLRVAGQVGQLLRRQQVTPEEGRAAVEYWRIW